MVTTAGPTSQDRALPNHTCPKPPILTAYALSGAYHALRVANPRVPEEEIYPALLKVLDRVLGCRRCRVAFLTHLQSPSVEAVVRNSLLLEAVRQSSP
jgi:hypothetical protein